MQKNLTRLFTAVLMAALLLSTAIISVSAAENCNCEQSQQFAGVLESGTYYLPEGGYTAAEAITVAKDSEVTLCLNDATLTVPSSITGSFITVNQGGKLTICGGKKGEGRIEGPGATTSTNDVRCLYVSVGGTLTLNGGTITGFRAGTEQANGGGVYVMGGEFIMNGGTIAGNYAVKDGAGVYVNKSTSQSAAGVYQFVMNDGIIGGTTLATSTTLSATTGNYAYASNGGAGVAVLGYGKVQLNGGEIKYNQSRTSGGGLWAGGTAQVELNGVAITDNKAGSTGGGVRLGQGYPHTMTAGSISNNTATGGAGGGVWLNTSGNFTLSGTGTISNNTAATDGGGIYTSAGTINLTGGSITGNTATKTGNGGGGVCVIGTGTFTMSGDTEISGNKVGSGSGGKRGCGVSTGNTVVVEISGGKIMDNEIVGSTTKRDLYVGCKDSKYSATIGGSAVIESLTVNAETPQLVISGGTFGFNPEEQGLALADNKTVENDPDGVFGTDTYVVTKITVVQGNYPNHDNWIAIYDSQENATAAQAAEGTYVVPGEDGKITLDQGSCKYYLAEDITHRIYAADAATAATIEVCLHGHSSIVASGDAGFYVGENVTMDLRNCDDEVTDNSGIIRGNTSTNGKAIMIVSGGTANMYAGVRISGTADESAAYAAAPVYVTGTFNMRGGEISYNAVTGTGGGVYVNSSAMFHMYGGTISHNTATSTGGGVHVAGGTFIMEDGAVITYNTSSATGYAGGGGICGYSSSTITLNGGEISYNTVTGCGGGVYVGGNNTFTMNSGSIFRNTAGSNGDGIYSGGSGNPLTISGGTIYDNYSDDDTSNAAIYGNSKIVINGEEVKVKGNLTGKNYEISAGMFSVTADDLDGKLAGNYTTEPVSEEGYSVRVVEDTSAPDHVCELYPSVTGWVQIGGSSEQKGTIKVGGYYFLGDNLTADDVGATTTKVIEVNVADNDPVVICLNGHNITPGDGSADTSVRVVNGKVTLCNCQSTTSVIYAGEKAGSTDLRALCVGDQSWNSTTKALTDTRASDELTIGGNIKISGISGVNAKSLVDVFYDGKLTMNEGVTITGYNGSNAAVNLLGGTFVMNGGSITDNNSRGVKVTKGTWSEMNTMPDCMGSFTMTAGDISLNDLTVTVTAEATDAKDATATANAHGGGVYVDADCTFTMNEGTISKNTATATATATSNVDGKKATAVANAFGGGVYVAGSFTMNDGTISENEVSGTSSANGSTTATKKANNYGSGGGVFVAGGGTFAMGGTDKTPEITQNTASTRGGGVSIEGATNEKDTEFFVMNSGSITGNIGGEWGGGVSVRHGKFTMNNGTIANNSLSGTRKQGTQVLVGNNGTATTTVGTFVMQNGIITGAGDMTLTDECYQTGDVVVGLGSATIAGGTINGHVGTVGYLAEKVTLTITGGSFNGAVTNGQIVMPGTQSRGECTIAISGGTFSNDTSEEKLIEFLAEDAAYVVNKSGSNYEVEEGIRSVDEYIQLASALHLSLSFKGDNDYQVENETYTIAVTDKAGNTMEDWTFDDSTNQLTVKGIAAKDMDDDITVTITRGDFEYTYTGSIRSVAGTMYYDPNNFASAKTALAELVNYGIAAKEYFTDDTSMEALDADASTLSNEGWTTEGASVTEGYENMVAVSLNLKDRIELNIYVKDANATVDGLKGESVADGIIRFTFNDIDVKDVKTTVKDFVVKLSETESFQVTCSIKNYVAVAKGIENAQQPLIHALMKYVDAVCALGQ